MRYLSMIMIVLLLAGCTSVEEEAAVSPEPFLIGDLYSEVLADVQYIEVGNGMNGEGLTIDDRSTIDSIVAMLSDVECRVRKNQEDRSGWKYSYKCYSANDHDWFQLIIGGSTLKDNIRSGDGTTYTSPYCDIYNAEEVVFFTNELFTLESED